MLHGGVVSALALHKMHSCLAWTLIYRAMADDDTFFVKSRKFLSLAYFLSFAGAFLPCLWIYMLVAEPGGLLEPAPGGRTGLIVTAASWALYFLAVPLEQWFYMHWKKDYPGWLSAYVSHLTMVHLCVVYFYYEGFPVSIHVALLTTVAVARPPLKWFSVISTTCILAVDAVNLNYKNIVRLPGYHRPGALEASVMSAFGYFCSGLGVLIAWLSSSEAARNVEAMKETDRFVRAAAPHIANYDLESVEHELEAYSEHEAGDSAVAGAFRDMLANLRKYRPFLPNYLFMRAGESPEEDVNSRLEMSQEEASLRSYSSPNSQVGSGSFIGPTGAWAPPVRAPSVARLELSEPSVIKRIAIASVILPGGDLGPAVERIFQDAPRYGASVHSCIGDELIATWNATARVPAFEAKACAFVCTLAGASGYILSSEAEVGTYGVTSKLFLASIGARSRAARAYLSGVGRATGRVVVNYGIYDNACASMDFEGHSFCEEEGVGPVFVLVGEAPDVGDEEWLYAAGRPVPMSCLSLLQRRMEAPPALPRP